MTNREQTPFLLGTATNFAKGDELGEGPEKSPRTQEAANFHTRCGHPRHRDD